MQKFTETQWQGVKRLLEEGGCPVLPEKSYQAVSPVGLKIAQVPSLGVNTVFDLENGQTGYMMDLVICNELDRPIRIQRSHIKTPWGGARISLLPAPAKSGPRMGQYCFPGSGTLAFESEVVLNHLLTSREGLNPGEHAGLFLGIDEAPIPSHFMENDRTLVELVIFDTRGNRYSSEFHLCVDRSASCARERREKLSAYSRFK
jgi:hypothetical protein